MTPTGTWTLECNHKQEHRSIKSSITKSSDPYRVGEVEGNELSQELRDQPILSLSCYLSQLMFSMATNG